MRGRMRAGKEVPGGHARSWLLTMVGSTLLTTVGSGRLTSIRLVVSEMELTIRAIARILSLLLIGKDKSKTNQLGLKLRSERKKLTERMILESFYSREPKAFAFWRS
jgi:hypothetical protein